MLLPSIIANPDKVLKTSLTPPATGSAFLELHSPAPSQSQTATLKITASVYGPRPLPSSAPFSPHGRVTAELKFAPFSTPHKRRGYVRDAVERDLSVQLQNALAKSIKTAAYPKSGIDVFVTVLDCEGGLEGSDDASVEIGLLNVLAGAITCCSTAIADAGIECFDLVSGGTAALVKVPELEGDSMRDMKDVESDTSVLVVDPSPTDGYTILSAAVVGYMAARDELTLVWSKGLISTSASYANEERKDDLDRLIDGAISTAVAVRLVQNAAVKERLLLGMAKAKATGKDKEADTGGDTIMT
jgi:exosome complex component MTR3